MEKATRSGIAPARTASRREAAHWAHPLRLLHVSKRSEIAIYRFEGEKIAQVWFFNGPSKPEDFSTVFAFA